MKDKRANLSLNVFWLIAHRYLSTKENVFEISLTSYFVTTQQFAYKPLSQPKIMPLETQINDHFWNKRE